MRLCSYYRGGYMDTKPHIQIILGSTRKGRQGSKVANWIYEEAQQRGDFSVELIDLADHPLPFLDENPSPAYLNGNYSHEEGKVWAALVEKADGYIIVSPEYNHGYPAVLKNALDYAYTEWNKKPAGLVTYSSGPWGGVRAAQQLRQVFVELQMVPIRNAVHLPFVASKFDDQGKMVDENTAKLAQTFFDQLIWWAKVLKSARAS